MVFAVYDFLERIIGCRYYTPDCEKIPFDANLKVCFEDYSYTPLYRLHTGNIHYYHFGSLTNKVPWAFS